MKSIHKWEAYTNGISTINLSRDDPACNNLCIQCIITYKYLKVLTSVLTEKNILPFLTAAQRKHVQIHVMKTCRQASVINSLLTLNVFVIFSNDNPEYTLFFL